MRGQAITDEDLEEAGIVIPSYGPKLDAKLERVHASSTVTSWKNTREIRECSDCKHPRKVKVTTYTYKDGHTTASHEKRCAACQDAARARHYARLSEQFSRRAGLKYAARAKKQLQGSFAPVSVTLDQACQFCGKRAIIELPPALRAEQTDGTTHVCHPLAGGCNHGFRRR